MTEQHDRLKSALEKLTPKTSGKKNSNILLIAFMCSALLLTSLLVSIMISVQADHLNKQNLMALKLGILHAQAKACVRHCEVPHDNKHP